MTIQERLMLACDAYRAFATIDDLRNDENRQNYRRLITVTVKRFRHSNLHSTNEFRRKVGLKELTL